jgi:hypothetical protein
VATNAGQTTGLDFDANTVVASSASATAIAAAAVSWYVQTAASGV